MKQYALNAIFFLGLIIAGPRSMGQSGEGALNVLYGSDHVFTIATPTGWIDDKALADQVGLVSFFYAAADSARRPRSIMYAQGYDKESEDETLGQFIQGDLDTYAAKDPAFTYDTSAIRVSGPVLRAVKYTFSGLSDRHKEEVVYIDAPRAIIVLSFSACSPMDYTTYKPVFDSFVDSFVYRGSNPKPFLKYWKKRGGS